MRVDEEEEESRMKGLGLFRGSYNKRSDITLGLKYYNVANFALTPDRP